MALEDPIAISAIVLAVVLAISISIVVVYTMRKNSYKHNDNQSKQAGTIPPRPTMPFSFSKSIQTTDANNAKNELRILELEREILGDAIRHLYEAHAEGKINEQEREKLSSGYKAKMMAVKESIAKDETIVALHELESMQEDLMTLFRSRFGELSGKVEELRSRIEIKPIKEVKIEVPQKNTPTIPEQIEKDEEENAEEEEQKIQEKPKKKRKSSSERQNQKTEAEKRIDEIRNQIDEVMNKLGQMEIES